METITIQTKRGRRCEIEVNVTEVSDHLLRFEVTWFILVSTLFGSAMFKKREIKEHEDIIKLFDRGCTIIRDMDGRPWFLVVIEIRSMPIAEDGHWFEILAETEGLKKVQRGKRRVA